MTNQRRTDKTEISSGFGGGSVETGDITRPYPMSIGPTEITANGIGWIRVFGTVQGR